MPAEWELHSATWLSWPPKRESWPGTFGRVPAVLVEVARHLPGSERVHINVADAAMQSEVEGLLRRAGVPLGEVRFFLIPTDDAWCRDHGPTFITRGTAGSHPGETELAVV